MWHIVMIGYVFTTFMFAIAQPSLARVVIYLIFWTILPTAFVIWVAITRRRNKIMKWQEQQDHAQRLQLENEKKLPENE
ncbi:hypothetical protein [Alysiella filiformis]|uniref:Uncharacterized protein n=1 Tax=Alysiella filiformis DSM 16848 TaxID=1120981 RepID=A0A286E786_9NEIS|nr:hypothetical protein [Alysiella filiformis]QMT31586.1 hypothetical protein H3L97_01350 [Alysiella filiformis]UBQ55402.1 hypothetical protein JF568_07325 [Alysiella filiformis DSM 16848]SOD66772.1 hypothetical protein SAMN02746062_00728 [Alysiella filiformis DSM 16848]